MTVNISIMALSIWGRLPTFKIPTHYNTCNLTLIVLINSKTILKLYTFMFKHFQNSKIERCFSHETASPA